MLRTLDGEPMLDGDEKPREVMVPNRAYGPEQLRLTGNQEEFCQAYVLGGVGLVNNGAASYEYAYGKRCPQSASKLLAKPHIEERVKELREELRRQANMTPEQFFAELNDAALGAKNAGQWSAAIKAIEIKGKAAGLLDETVRMEVKDGRTRAERLADMAEKLATNENLVTALMKSNPTLWGLVRRQVEARRLELAEEAGEDLG